MSKFSGIDLHSNNSVVVVSDDADRVVYQRRLPNAIRSRSVRRWRRTAKIWWAWSSKQRITGTGLWTN
ncbi:hypothetical protein QF000_008000 [Paraburkholderia atlantica]